MTNQPLTYEEIKNNAPSVFTTEPSEKVSKKYTFIPTLQSRTKEIQTWYVTHQAHVKI